MEVWRGKPPGRPRNRGWVTAVLFFLPVWVLMCSWPPAALGQEYLRFGCVLSLTGLRALSGGYYRRAYDLAAEWLNGQGGFRVGDRAYRAQIVCLDDESDETKTAPLYEKLVREEQVKFLLGPYGGAAVAAAAPVADKVGLPMIQAGGAAPEVFGRGGRFLFGLIPRDDEYLAPAVGFMGRLDPRPERVVMAYADDRFNAEVAAGARRMLAAAGWALAADVEYPMGTKDLSAVAAKLGEAKPDAVILAGYDEEARLLVRLMKDKDIQAKFICLSAGVSVADFTRILGPDAEYIYGISTWEEDLELTGGAGGDSSAFEKFFRERYGRGPEYHAAAAAAALVVYRLAIEKAGTLEPRQVRDAIAATDADTFYGRVAFRPDGQVRGNHFLYQVQGGEAAMVYPVERKKAVYPMPPWKERKKAGAEVTP